MERGKIGRYLLNTSGNCPGMDRLADYWVAKSIGNSPAAIFFEKLFGHYESLSIIFNKETI